MTIEEALDANAPTAAAAADATEAVASPTTGTAIKKTFNFPPEYVEVMKQLATARSTSVTEVLKHAVAIEKYLYELTKKGGKFYFESPEGDRKEVVFTGYPPSA